MVTVLPGTAILTVNHNNYITKSRN